jgi:hypothetical protein
MDLTKTKITTTNPIRKAREDFRRMSIIILKDFQSMTKTQMSFFIEATTELKI